MNMAKIHEDMEDILMKLADKLACKESDIRLSFQELSLDLGVAIPRLIKRYWNMFSSYHATLN